MPIWFILAFWGTRHTFAFMGFVGYAICMSLRVDLAVAIVSMVNTSEFF